MRHSANALIAAAKRETPRASLEGDVLGAIGVAALAPVLHGAPAARAFGAKLWLALKHAAVSKAGVAAIAFAAATGGYAAGRMQERALHDAPVAPAQTIALAQRTPTRTQTPAPTQTPTRTRTDTVAAVPTISSTFASARAMTSPKPLDVAPTLPPPPPTTSLADEVAAIKRARAALLGKDAAATLAALDDYNRAHPSGVMSEESLALRVRAARLAGDDAAAAAALAKLEARFPESIQLAALRR